MTTALEKKIPGLSRDFVIYGLCRTGPAYFRCPAPYQRHCAGAL